MEHNFDVRQGLRVFQFIADQGQKVDDGYLLEGLRAYSDFDGYTLFITNERVTLSIFFHNKFKFDFERTKELEDFAEAIARIDRRNQS